MVHKLLLFRLPGEVDIPVYTEHGPLAWLIFLSKGQWEESGLKSQLLLDSNHTRIGVADNFYNNNLHSHVSRLLRKTFLQSYLCYKTPTRTS